MSISQQLKEHVQAWRSKVVLRGRAPIAFPTRDWEIALSLGLLMFMLFVCAAGLVYWQEGTLGDQPAPAPATSTFSPETLSTLLAQYQALAAEHQVLLLQGPQIADPAQSK